MARALAIRLDSLEQVFAPAEPEAALALIYALRVVKAGPSGEFETDEEVRARASRSRLVGAQTEVVIIDLYAREQGK